MGGVTSGKGEGMKLTGAVAVALLAIPAVAVTPAEAASTRAEYIAQADPICQTFVGPMNQAWAAYDKNSKSAERHLKKGSYGNWVRLIRRTARSLDRLAQTRTAMVNQVATVTSPVPDTQTIGAWLSYLRQEAGFEASAASALRKLQIGKTNHRNTQADLAQEAANRALSGFGFQVCGVSV
jgi:hypothetical protein